jgi:flagellar basal-body rod modification protein FlgD
MQLMITQLQNQDPSNPADDQQMAAQIAQFTSLESLQNIQTSIESLGTTLTDATTAQTAAANSTAMGSAVSLLGQQAEFKQTTIASPASGQTDSIQVQASAGSVLAIQDSTGKTVRTIPLDGTNTNGSSILDSNGNGTATWDGKDDNGASVTAGTYTLSVQDSASGASTGYAYSTGTVTGVGQDANGATLQTAAGTYHLSDLVQLASSSTTSSTASANSAAASEAIALIGHTAKLRDASATLSDTSSGATWNFNATSSVAEGEILDSSGNVVDTFSTSGQNADGSSILTSDGSGSYTGAYQWNGQTSSGAQAPLGTYTLQLVGSDGTTVQGAAYKQVTIDGTGFDSNGQPVLLSGNNAWSLSTLYTVS